MSPDTIIVTSIFAPTGPLRKLAAFAEDNRLRLLVIGDTKSPPDFFLSNCDFWSITRQRDSSLTYAQICPERSYARKNIGYLLSARSGSEAFIETDDDNAPKSSGFIRHTITVSGKTPIAKGWVNAYRFFTDEYIWPRGFPLECLQASMAPLELQEVESRCPIQQALADGNPDVDAVYRLILRLPFEFRQTEESLVLGKGQWCPFNSQNTIYFREAFPLAYIPATCSFRMCDIWRSFIAQRILWECDRSVSFHGATVFQERNDHDLLRDFSDEVPGYLGNNKFIDVLMQLELKPGLENIPANLVKCYDALIAHRFFLCNERQLLDAYLLDLLSS